MSDFDYDPELSKELMGSRFQFEILGHVYNKALIAVSTNDRLLGVVTKKQSAGKKEWFISYVTPRRLTTHFPVDGIDEAAELLLQDADGTTEIPEIKPPIDHIPPAPELESAAHDLVNLLSDDTEPDIDNSPNAVVSRALSNAGFNVTESIFDAGRMRVEFTWPTGNNAAYVNGWRRAREVISEHFELRRDNFLVQRSTESAKAVLVENYGIPH